MIIDLKNHRSWKSIIGKGKIIYHLTKHTQAINLSLCIKISLKSRSKHLHTSSNYFFFLCMIMQPNKLKIHLYAALQCHSLDFGQKTVNKSCSPNSYSSDSTQLYKLLILYHQWTIKKTELFFIGALLLRVQQLARTEEVVCLQV